MSLPPVEYIPDASVNESLDRELRDTLSTCFKKPGDEVFCERRYWRELPQHRWFIRTDDGHIIAHVAVHEKIVVYGGKEHRIGGIAEVCVRPEQRGHGYVKLLLANAHAWLRARSFEYAVLFGDPKVYTSSGYSTVQNLVSDVPDATGKLIRQTAKGAMVTRLAGPEWPTTEVFLPGKIF